MPSKRGIAQRHSNMDLRRLLIWGELSLVVVQSSSTPTLFSKSQSAPFPDANKDEAGCGGHHRRGHQSSDVTKIFPKKAAPDEKIPSGAAPSYPSLSPYGSARGSHQKPKNKHTQKVLKAEETPPNPFGFDGFCLSLTKKMHIYKLSNRIRFSHEVPEIIRFIINSCILFWHTGKNFCKIQRNR